ncbi:MAG: LuxR C-terminal-related transcriptional regulator [Chloroflexota bacterium]|nr:LuxR C-terminal-related transcriptional regulator [Chloroflexota bacterium]
MQTTFVGRCSDLAVLRGFLLDPEKRLISVLGPGGVGKTRLAVVAAERAAGDFPDGVTFVALSGLSEPKQVADAVASTLRIRGEPDRPMLESVLTALASERLLLVLDNLEHLMGPDLQNVVSRLVQECPGVCVLTTSREPLRLGFEQRVGIGPLGTPDQADPMEKVGGTDAVQLFVTRARAVVPEFAPGPSQLRTIGEICRHVDGLPLAIELAAAWIRVFSPVALLAQLNERLPLLTGGPVDQPARFHTMRDAIAWSYDRLPPEESALLRRFSVFRGGFSLEAAMFLGEETVLSVPSSTLRLVASLCDKHLLFRAVAVGEFQRFGMLETIREFALEQLQATGEFAPAQAAHANYYRDLAERIEPELLGPQESFWFDVLDAEASNLREAISWCLRDDVESALRILAAMWGYWSWRAIAEGRRLFGTALALPGQGSPGVRARGLRSACALANLGGDHQTSAALAAESRVLAQSIDDRWLIGEMYWHCALSSIFAGDLQQAVQEFDQALQLMVQPRTDSERAIAAYALSHRGFVSYLTGDPDLGSRYFLQSIDGLRKTESATLLIIVLGDAAGWLLRDDRIEAARELLHEALNLCHQSLVSWAHIAPLAGLALTDALEGRSIRASRRLGAVVALATRAGLASAPNFQGTLDQAESLASNSLGRAAFLAEWETGRRNPAPVVEEAFATAGQVSCATGDDVSRLHVRLTPREREVLHLIVAGSTDRDIAGALFISERTVSKHVSKILQKLDAVSRGDAAVRAVRLGLV